MTQGQKEEVIASFHSGRVNLLVASAVEEEGIDIHDCNYVIRYDMLRGNKIASMSRWHERDKNGEYKVVAGKETGVFEKQNLGTIGDVMVKDAIKEDKAMYEDEYKWKVQKYM